MTTRTDQRGVVRDFLYDKLGGLSDDCVSNLGGSGVVDSAILRISRAYEVRGMVSQISSYDSATVGSGSLVNQVQLDYNEFAQLSKEWQAHDAAGVTGSTPNVQYGYDAGGSSSNEIRPTTLTYPDGKAISYNYGTSNAMNDLLNRIESIKDGSTVLGTYTYLGLGTIIRLKYPQPDAWLDLWGGTSGTFAGLDLFGRVTDQLWQNNVSSTPVAIDRYQYGYDRNSNRQYRANVVGTTAVGNLDEYYTYDNLNRLTIMQRGTLSGNPPTIGSVTVEQDWTLDPTGNWSGYITKAGITTTLDQTRTSNAVNEITGISETAGPSWVDPAYDAAGNMITGPLGTTPTTKLHFVFDAWNRMVTVKADSSGSPGSTIASYAYDGRNRRITKTIGGNTYHGYYNNNWQYLETRIGTSTSSSGQIVWDLRYIDSPLVLLGGANPLYYTNDANFNVTALINGGTGTVSERSQYDPYGKVQFYTAAWATALSSAANNPILYAGYTFDSESGWYLARNRYLNVATGTWVRRDPIGYWDSFNLYEYAKGDPIAMVDPSGLATRVFIRCTPVERTGVTFGWHCAIVASCDGSTKVYEIGGEKMDKPDDHNAMKVRYKSGEVPIDFIEQMEKTGEKHKYFKQIGTILWSTDPNSPWKAYSVECSKEHCPCETLDCLNQAFEKANLPEYKRMGPNSNTFAHALLTKCSCHMSPFWTWEMMKGELGNIDEWVELHVNPEDAVGWNTTYDYFDKWEFAGCQKKQ